MAIYAVKNLLTSGDYLRTTRRYSSPQSLSRAGKNGHHQVHSVSGLRLVHMPHPNVANVHGISSWEGIPTVDQMPAGLQSLRQISRKVKVGEAVMLGWALLNRMDIYWVGGHFAARYEDAHQIAMHEEKRKAALTKPPKERRRRTYL